MLNKIKAKKLLNKICNLQLIISTLILLVMNFSKRILDILFNKKLFLKYIILISILSTYTFSYAQTQYQYTGTIYSSDSSLLLKNVQIINQRTKQTLYSDNFGLFTIDAHPYDSIIFVHPHWNSIKIEAYYLPDQIFLQKKPIVLEEIVIMGNTKAGKIRELENMKRDYDVKGGIFYNGKPPLYLLNPFGGSPLTYFYEKFSKAGKNARRFNDFMDKELENMEIDQIFNKVNIYEIIPMDNDELERFMVAYRPDFEVAKTWTSYDLHVYVKKSYKEFKDNGSGNQFILK